MISTTIRCNELAQKIELIATNTVKILFTTMTNAPASKPDLVRETSPLYIPNSLFFDFEHVFVDKKRPFGNMMPSVEVFQSAAHKLSLRLDDEIIVYDDFGNFCASRAWFMLISMGFTNVRTLDGGLPEWVRGNYPTITTLLRPKSTTDIQIKPAATLSFVDAEYISTKLAMLDSGSAAPASIQIIDARSNGRYTGSEPEPRANMRSGHIPRSVNIHYASLQNEGVFKSLDELRSIFDDSNINLDEEIVTSCGSGITACIVAQAAISLGASCVYVYDASWSEWGASQTLPIEVSQ
ncbi:MAG: thiosulfate/3-mercaptopyruvate sulfurtransferase [Glaciecola sp.]|jgi:thiosulfate/3-mercaptopyruvate sulfurtransferase